MNIAGRSNEKELLDEDDIPFSDIVGTMRELNVINTLLGGHRITCMGIDHFLRKDTGKGPLSIAEIGCGGGDNLAAISRHLEKKKRSFALTGIDIKQECIEYARQNRSTGVNWVCSDYRDVQWPGDKPDIIFSSLFCHHFTDLQLVEQLIWLKKNSKAGFFINDLQRNIVAYQSIRLLTKAFSKSYLVKNDAPISVLRGFRKQEWEDLLKIAGIEKYSISWQWAFRYLICVGDGR